MWRNEWENAIFQRKYVVRYVNDDVISLTRHEVKWVKWFKNTYLRIFLYVIEVITIPLKKLSIHQCVYTS